MKLHTSLAFFAIILLSACGSYKPWYAAKYEGWNNHQPPATAPVFTFYLIGDAGKPNLQEQEPSLAMLNRHLLQAGKNSMVVFLGDNIYESGMPALNHDNRPKAEARLYESVKAVQGYKGSVLFIPGNHDWYAANDSFPDGLIHQREYLYEKLGSEHVFLPKDGKPGPAVLEMGGDVVLVVLDSYRWVRDLPKPKAKRRNPEMPEPEFHQELRQVLEKYQDKQVVMVAHHPLYTNGGHGGYSPFADHLFPLRLLHKNLWIPLPILGSILPTARRFGGVIEDIPHPRYRQYRKVILDASKKNPGLVYAAGHEHSLQMFQKHDKHFIVSGSGTKSSWVRKGKGAAFNHIGKGFCKLDIYASGEVWATYYEPNELNPKEEMVVFRWKLAEGNK